VRLIEIRLLEGPNVYRLEPTVKIELAVGRRRSWYGQRSPGRHAVVRLSIPAARSAAPVVVRDIAAWVERLHRDTGSAAWLAEEGRATPTGRVRIPVAVHRTSDPGHWIVAFPWRQRGKAEAIAEAA
jgi:cyanophycin synthetase